MTRKEAIAYFKDMNECTYGDVEPIQMAIKALEEEPCEDCISRQTLIERINNAEESFKADNMDSITSDDGDPFVDGVLSGVFNIRQMVIQAPSVMPKQEPKTDEDCISRKDLLKKCVHVPIAPLIAGEKVFCEKVVFAMDIINAEPIKQEQKTANWQKYKSMIYCSKCGASIEAGYLNDMKYCYNCGAKMEGEV